MNALHFGDPTREHWSFFLQALTETFSVRLNILVPATALTCRRSLQVSSWRGHCFGLAEDLRNVSVVQTLHQLQQYVSYSASCQSIETSYLQKLFTRHTSGNSVERRVARSICKSFPFKSLQQTLDPHVITRQVRVRTHHALLGKSPGSDNFNFFQPRCSLLSSSGTCKTMRIDCGNADDEDDPPCVIDVDDVCDVETASGSCSVVCSANLTFFMFGSASETGRDILSCESLTRTLRANI